MENTKKLPFGFEPVVLQAAITRDTEAHNLYETLMSLSLLIRGGKGQIIKTKRGVSMYKVVTKRFLNEAVVAKKYCKLLRSYNLPNPIDDHAGSYASVCEAIKEYTKELHVHQKDLRKIYVAHNKTVEEFKKVVEKFARTCAIRHNPVSLKDMGDIEGLPKIKEEQTLTSLNLSRVGVLTLIKKLTDEIKAKPNCNKFTITLKTGVTKG